MKKYLLFSAVVLCLIGCENHERVEVNCGIIKSVEYEIVPDWFCDQVYTHIETEDGNKHLFYSRKEVKIGEQLKKIEHRKR